MSFDIKYDRNGVPIKSTGEPRFEESTPVIQEAPIAEVSVESQTDYSQEMVENQGEIVEDTSKKHGNDIVEEQPIVPIAKPAAQESWKTIRDRMAQAEKRTQELEEALKHAQSKPKEVEVSEEDLSIDLDEDALAEGKHLKKVDKRFQKMQRELDQYKQQAAVAHQQSALNEVKMKLKNQYPDWDQVFTDENMARLQLQEPEIYHTLNSSSDTYRSGVSAYKMIKQLGIASPEDVYSSDKAQAQRNAAKPKVLASISPQQGDSPLSKANAFANGNLTDDLKKSLWREMNEYRK